MLLYIIKVDFLFQSDKINNHLFYIDENFIVVKLEARNTIGVRDIIITF